MIDFSNLIQIRSELTQAIKLNNKEHLKVILNNELVNLNYIDKDGQTPLHRSCQLGQLSIVELLCEFGASQSIQNKEGWFPIHLAAYYGHMDIVYFLLKQQSTDILVIDTKTNENNKSDRNKISLVEDDDEYDDNEEYYDSYNEQETDDDDDDKEEENDNKNSETNEFLMLNFSNLKL